MTLRNHYYAGFLVLALLSMQPAFSQSPADSGPGSDSGRQDDLQSNGGASRTTTTTFSSEPWPERTEPTPELPVAPESFAKLIEAGNVSFTFYDRRQYRRRFEGETQFSLKYTTRVEFTWQARSRGRQTELIVRPNWESIELQHEHKILLPIQLAREDFYEQQLVKHEFDHVRISTDPRVDGMFRQEVGKSLRVIRVRCDPGSDYNAVARTAIDESIERLFQRTLSLVRIRYQELDRQTQHGTTLTPEAFFTAPSEWPQPDQSLSTPNR